ncbi:MAG: J domain-containing protein, partial [Armatimonadota bacterium]
MSEGKTHYEVLGLSPDADADQIRKRFRELARKYHPDVNPGPGAHEMFLRINQAYDVLGDATRRASYDLTLRDRARKQQPPPGGRPSPPPGAARAGGSRTGATAGRPGAGGSAASGRGTAGGGRGSRETKLMVGSPPPDYLHGPLH